MLPFLQENRVRPVQGHINLQRQKLCCTRHYPGGLPSICQIGGDTMGGMPAVHTPVQAAGPRREALRHHIPVPRPAQHLCQRICPLPANQLTGPMRMCQCFRSEGCGCYCSSPSSHPCVNRGFRRDGDITQCTHQNYLEGWLKQRFMDPGLLHNL